MVQLAWYPSEASVDAMALVPLSNSPIGPQLFDSWELTAVTLPGCLACIAFPSCAYFIVSLYRLFLGTLYPAYSSYKAIRTKDVDEYVS